VEITDLTAVQTLSVPVRLVQLHRENGAARLLTAPFARTHISPACCLPQDKGFINVSTSPLPMCFPMSISGGRDFARLHAKFAALLSPA